MVNYEMSVIHFSSQNSSRNVTLFSQMDSVAIIVCIYIAPVIPETLNTQQTFTNFIYILIAAIEFILEDPHQKFH